MDVFELQIVQSDVDDEKEWRQMWWCFLGGGTKFPIQGQGGNIHPLLFSQNHAVG